MNEVTAEHLARKYYRYINAKDVDGVLSLLAPDAIFRLPDGNEVEGHEALRWMYARIFSAGGPQPQPMRMIATATEAAVEVEVGLADGKRLQMASFFTMGSGQTFDRVTVYRRGS